jgi:hypothetical protein
MYLGRSAAAGHAALAAGAAPGRAGGSAPFLPALDPQLARPRLAQGARLGADYVAVKHLQACPYAHLACLWQPQHCVAWRHHLHGGRDTGWVGSDQHPGIEGRLLEGTALGVGRTASALTEPTSVLPLVLASSIATDRCVLDVRYLSG